MTELELENLLATSEPEDKDLQARLNLMRIAERVRNTIGSYAVDHGQASEVEISYPRMDDKTVQPVRGFIGERTLIEPASPSKSARQTVENFAYWVDLQKIAHGVISTLIFEGSNEEDPPARIESRAISVWPNGDFRWRFWDRRGMTEAQLTQQGLPGVNAIPVPVEDDKSGEIVDRISVIQHHLCNFNSIKSDRTSLDENKATGLTGLTTRLSQLLDIMSQHIPSDELYDYDE